MNRILLGVVALVGCAGLAVLTLRHAREDTRATPQRGAAVEETVPAAERSPGEVATPTEPQDEKPRGPASSGLAGTIVVIDEEGREHPQEDGSFSLVLWTGGLGESETVDVSDGKWQAQLQGPGELEAREIRLGARLAYAEENDIPVSAAGSVSLRARWMRPSVLHVVDDATGRDLADLDVVRYDRSGVEWDAGRNVNPTGARVERAVPVGATSPVTLPERVDDPVYWVRAPGYAWCRISIDHRVGGKHVVRLTHGGTLEVALVNCPASSLTRLSLRPAVDAGNPPAEEGRPLLERPVAGDGLSIEGLEAGRYDVRVSLRSWFDRPLVLGSAVADIGAGGVATVTIVLADAPATRDVPVRGTLSIPKSWGDWSPYLSISPSLMFREREPGDDEPGGAIEPHIAIFPHQMVRGERGIRHWDAGGMPPGDYVATVGDIAYQVRFRVGVAGETAIRIEIPEAAECKVRTVDSRTGKTAPVLELWWNPVRPQGLTGGSLSTVEASPEPGTFSLRAPVGRIELAPVDNEWTSELQDFEIRKGSNEIALQVSRQCGIRVTLKEGSVIVRGGDDFEFEVTCLEGDGETAGSGSDASSHWVYLSGAGRYEVKVRAPKGYEEIPPKVVTVGEGETADVVVEIRRRE